MARFFTSLSDDMAGGTAAAVFSDTLTVLAALVHAGVPLSAGKPAAALGWELDRVIDALASSEKHPDIADPVAVRHVGPDTYAVEPRPDRLTKAQRNALSSIVA